MNVFYGTFRDTGSLIEEHDISFLALIACGVISWVLTSSLLALSKTGIELKISIALSTSDA